MLEVGGGGNKSASMGDETWGPRHAGSSLPAQKVTSTLDGHDTAPAVAPAAPDSRRLAPGSGRPREPRQNHAWGVGSRQRNRGPAGTPPACSPPPPGRGRVTRWGPGELGGGPAGRGRLPRVLTCAERRGRARERASRGPSPDLCRGLHRRAWGLGAAGSEAAHFNTLRPEVTAGF